MPYAVSTERKLPLICLRWLGTVRSTPEGERERFVFKRYRSQRSLLLAAVFFAVFQFLLAYVLDGLSPGRRDPEYALRLHMCRQRQAEYPHRPLIVVLGNSRSAMGICPSAWEASIPSQRTEGIPMLFNFGLVGAGPMLQELAARRLIQDGIRPALVLWEYWPPFLHHDERWNEHQRINKDRLSPRDLPWVTACYPPEEARLLHQNIWWQHLLPCWSSRERILLQLVPEWIPPERRIDWTWKYLDGWGWYPGLDAHVLGMAGREKMTQQCQEIYQPLLARYRSAKEAEAALYRGVQLLQKAGIIVVLIYLPESKRFQDWYSPHAEGMILRHRQQLQRDLDVEWLDTRSWMEETDFIDGFHLSRQGAAAFTQRLGQLLTCKFPTSGR